MGLGKSPRWVVFSRLDGMGIFRLYTTHRSFQLQGSLVLLLVSWPLPHLLHRRRARLRAHCRHACAAIRPTQTTTATTRAGVSEVKTEYFGEGACDPTSQPSPAPSPLPTPFNALQVRVDLSATPALERYGQANPSERLRLQAVVNTSSAVFVRWSSSPALSLPDEESVYSSAAGASAVILVVKEHVLVPGREYVFTVHATDASGAVGVASARVPTNTPPVNGSFAVTPSAGAALATPFQLGASGWLDFDLPLRFIFSVELDVDSETPLATALACNSTPTPPSQCVTLLPMGDRENHNLTIALVVADTLGAAAPAVQATAHVEFEGDDMLQFVRHNATRTIKLEYAECRPETAALDMVWAARLLNTMDAQTDNVTMDARRSLLMMLSTHDGNNATAGERGSNSNRLRSSKSYRRLPRLGRFERFGALALTNTLAQVACMERRDLDDGTRALAGTAETHLRRRSQRDKLLKRRARREARWHARQRLCCASALLRRRRRRRDRARPQPRAQDPEVGGRTPLRARRFRTQPRRPSAAAGAATLSLPLATLGDELADVVCDGSGR